MILIRSQYFNAKWLEGEVHCSISRESNCLQSLQSFFQLKTVFLAVSIAAMSEQEISNEEESYYEEEEVKPPPKKKRSKKKPEAPPPSPKMKKKKKVKSSSQHQRSLSPTPIPAPAFHQYAPPVPYTPPFHPRMHSQQHFPISMSMPQFNPAQHQKIRMESIVEILKMTIQSKLKELGVPSGTYNIDIGFDDSKKTIRKASIITTIREYKDK